MYFIRITRPERIMSTPEPPRPSMWGNQRMLAKAACAERASKLRKDAVLHARHINQTQFDSREGFQVASYTAACR